MDKIIKIFIEEPEKEFHVREVAKNLEISPTTVSKYLNKLEKEGVLVSRKMSNHLLFKANSSNAIYKRMKKESNLQNILSGGLITYLSEELNNPEAIVLFGSYAKGENIKTSDIDILVISPLKKELDLGRFEKKLKHKLQLFIYSRKEVDAMKIRNKELLNNMINGVVLSGFWEVFR